MPHKGKKERKRHEKKQLQHTQASDFGFFHFFRKCFFLFSFFFVLSHLFRGGFLHRVHFEPFLKAAWVESAAEPAKVGWRAAGRVVGLGAVHRPTLERIVAGLRKEQGQKWEKIRVRNSESDFYNFYLFFWCRLRQWERNLALSEFEKFSLRIIEIDSFGSTLYMCTTARVCFAYVCIESRYVQGERSQGLASKGA